MIIHRYTDIERLKNTPFPILVYGRRKTGKTFLVKHTINGKYFFVRRDRSILHEKKTIREETLRELIEERDKRGEISIIDEFHRLGEEFMDYLHYTSPKNVILITSTLNLAKHLLSSSSPLLGLFSEFRVDLIDERDILRNLKEKEIENKVEKAVYLREPIMARFFNGRNLLTLLNNLKLTVPSLVGESFIEERKRFSERYEAILRAIALGKHRASEMSSFLFSNGLIEKESVSEVKQYVENLISLGYVKKVRDYFSRRNYYYIVSPIVDMYYYLDEKYGFSEMDLDKKYFAERLPFHIEQFFSSLFAKLFSLREVKINKPDMELDISLVSFNKLKVVGEVKWKNRLTVNELKKIEDKLNRFECKRILVVKRRDALPYEPEGIEVFDEERIMRLVSQSFRI